MLRFFFVYQTLFAPAPLSQDTAVAITEASIESDFDATATECPGHSAFRHHDDPSWASPSHPCYCGLWQTTATSEKECRAQREPLHGLMARNEQLHAWKDECIRLGASDDQLTHCIIAGYAVGGDGALEIIGKKHTDRGLAGARYANWLLWRASNLRSAMLTSASLFH